MTSAIQTLCGQAYGAKKYTHLWASFAKKPSYYTLAQQFLQAHNIVNPLDYLAVGAFFSHLLLSWLAIDVLKYGLLGAALANSLSWKIHVVMSGLYIVLSPSCKETWLGLSAKAFQGTWPYFKLTIASAIMLWYVYAPMISHS
ncbi:hypothetical protein Syun_009423 [Stephania yunnanensis]|uniref:Uncharacterized protein n=1 Tax=Stephania yunnanensis TaxID=152371 RepID=A0AAP0KGC6_9MAGN